MSRPRREHSRSSRLSSFGSGCSPSPSTGTTRTVTRPTPHRYGWSAGYTLPPPRRPPRSRRRRASTARRRSTPRGCSSPASCSRCAAPTSCSNTSTTTGRCSLAYGTRPRAADIAVSSLESSLTSFGMPTPCRETYVLQGSPRVVDALAEAGIDVVFPIGNHIGDCWGGCAAGTVIIDTVELLNEAGIATAGAGENLAAARSPAVRHGGDGERAGAVRVPRL